MKWEIEIRIEVCIITMNYHQLQIGFDYEFIWINFKQNHDDENELKSNGENEIHDWMIVYNDKITQNWYNKKNLYILMEIIKIYGKMSDKWQNWIEMIQYSSRNQFIKEIIISIISIDKNNLIREMLYILYRNEKKWIYEK